MRFSKALRRLTIAAIVGGYILQGCNLVPNLNGLISAFIPGSGG